MGKKSETKIKQLTMAERTRIDGMIRQAKASPTDALRRINKDRCKKGIREVEKSCVYRFAKGLTHAGQRPGLGGL